MFFWGNNNMQESEILKRDKQKLQEENNGLIQVKEKIEGEKKI